MPYSTQDLINAIHTLRPFISESQMQSLASAMRGEERAFFRQKVVEMAERINAMPKTYEQEGLGDKAVVYLHYFKNGCDWHVTEKDKLGVGTEEAFGLADMGQAELGYFNIAELTRLGVELDLYFEPTTLAEIQQSKAA